MKLLSVHLLYSVKDTDVDSHLCNMSRSMKISNGLFLRWNFIKKIVKLLSCKTVVMCILTLFLVIVIFQSKEPSLYIAISIQMPSLTEVYTECPCLCWGSLLCHSCLLSSFKSSLSLFAACLASGRPCPQCQGVARKKT